MQGGIVLFAKRPGLTSFSSLYSIKRALATKKVGHTGTLDSFASGLLVVCTGSLTRLASYITSFNKTYDAVIEFGSETDTLEYTGKIVKTAPLPKKDDVLSAIEHYTGDILQTPPLFSALHINGERASDIARSGRSAEMPSRPVTVFASEAEEFLFEDGRVKAVRVRFSVSKGTYIRSLARDIGSYCKSAAHLAGLRRLSVGSFRLEDAAGFSSLAPFTIRSVYKTISDMQKTQSASCKADASEHTPHSKENEQSEVLEKMQSMTERLAAECGFGTTHILSAYEDDFKHGRPLFSSMFEKETAGACAASAEFSANGTCASGGVGSIAVFGKHGIFLGMISRRGEDTYSYAFVVPD
ncbi:tRNA pseudouridine(55) synthase TruB [Treponema sp. Marseille-Q4132]|uniref:tRNA pseudouridine(55) synthase TruB n=1 Tax=Treponema sp. Marseille-Q4132 TaxID=2766701 RepID=UPI00165323F0|nr:tRNA pseudouridine(55) synthase TruB [Treponema sp. Marseille-Q4132]QNL97402.1 tRNA pseudouridine(55) synthase TruB [Treponema sp. Marseille-Q4132]